MLCFDMRWKIFVSFIAFFGSRILVGGKGPKDWVLKCYTSKRDRFENGPKVHDRNGCFPLY